MDEQVDRLSGLPNDVIHLILSFIDIKDAIRTSVLSSRYRFTWTSLPYLNFSNVDFWKPGDDYNQFPYKNSLPLPKFSKFVTHVLCGRDTQIEVYSVKLDFLGNNISHESVKSILNYAFSHNVQQMTVTYMADRNYSDFPLSLFTCQSLKHLTLCGFGEGIARFIKPWSTWELPVLTTLHLNGIIFNDLFTDLLFKCSNLKNLSLSHSCIVNEYEFSHPRLSNLTLINQGYGCYNHDLNVDAPRLKNLTIKDWSPVHLSSTPKLESLVFKGHHSQISMNSPNCLCSLEKADLCFYDLYYEEDNARIVVDLLQQIRRVKYLRLNMETIQLLSSFKELVSHQPFSFANLTSIKVYPHDELSMSNETTPIEMKLTKSSSGATLTFVCEEIIALTNAVSAENCMEKLWVILENEKANCETNISPLDNQDTHMVEKGETRVENEKAQTTEKKQPDIRGRMTKMDICLTDLGLQINQGIARTSCIFNMLREVEKLLRKEVHTSKRDKLQASFTSLQAEAETTVKKIIDQMKIQFDEKQSHLSYCFHELAK